MNNLEYLNHISQTSRPVSNKPTSSSPLSPIIKIIVGGVVALIVVLIIGVIVRNSSNQSTLAQQIYYRTTTLSETITNYNPSIKSSKLRSIATSLSGTLTGASAQLDNYFTAIDQEPDLSESALAAEEPAFIALEDSLRTAKLNGILDRIYPNEVGLQVSLLLSLIAQAIGRTKDADLIAILDQYYANLTVIQDNLSTYSNPSD